MRHTSNIFRSSCDQKNRLKTKILTNIGVQDMTAISQVYCTNYKIVSQKYSRQKNIRFINIYLTC